MDEDDFDLGGFDEAYSPDDFSQADMDFATAVGQQTGGFGDDNTAQVIANQLAQPQLGQNRSNIVGSSTYDPTFAAAFDISRGLDPTGNFQGTGGLAVPSYLRPQIESGRVDARGEPIRYSSGFERFLQEDVTDFVKSGPGIVSLIGNFLSDNFNDAKKALGLDGGAQGGLKAEDFTGLMGTRDDQQISDMSQTGAEMSVTDPVVTRPTDFTGMMSTRTPTFDAFGNVTRDANMSRFADQFGQINAGIASVAPNQAKEVGDAMRDTFVTTTPDFSVPGFKSSPMSKKEAEDIKKSLGIMNISNRTDPRNVFLNERATQQFSGPVLSLPDQVVNQMPFRNEFDVGTMKGFDLLDNFNKLDREEALYGRAIRENELEI